MRKLTQEEFIARATSVHGGKYDYSQSIYVNSRTEILVRCKRCGTLFTQNPHTHLCGSGCRVCGMKDVGIKQKGVSNHKAKRPLFGIGINDIDICVLGDRCYEIWHSILQRTIDKKYKESHKAYKDATLCEEWLFFSNFKNWFDKHFVEGFTIDKDLFGFNSKCYSPDTCVFLPKEINCAITRAKNKGNLPMGVTKNGKKYYATCCGVFLGSFDSVEDASKVYLRAKKKRIIELAKKWKDKIEQRAYDALINLDVEKFFNKK